MTCSSLGQTTLRFGRTLFYILSMSQALSAQSLPGKYVSPDRSFELTVPAGYIVLTGSVKTTLSYIPLCRDKSIVCITFPSDRYKGTTFNGASAEVTVLVARTRQACLHPGDYEISTSPDAEFRVDLKNPSRLIDGTRFLRSSSEDAAMSHYVLTDRYRGFDNGKCYELETRVAFSNFGVYSPGSIKEFARADQSRVRAELSDIVNSFRSFR